MCFVARRVRKKVNIKTKNEKIVETDMDIWYYTYENSYQFQEERVQCTLLQE